MRGRIRRRRSWLLRDELRLIELLGPGGLLLFQLVDARFERRILLLESGGLRPDVVDVIGANTESRDYRDDRRRRLQEIFISDSDSRGPAAT